MSVDILKKFQPVVLEDVYPARVAADGNCLYRAISKVVCGNEALFILLRKRKINERSAPYVLSSNASDLATTLTSLGLPPITDSSLKLTESTST
jgi:hypothetical protein